MRLRIGNLLRATVGFVLLLLLSLASSPASAASPDELLRDGEAVTVPGFNYDDALTVSLRSGEAAARASAAGTDRSEDPRADPRDLVGIFDYVSVSRVAPRGAGAATDIARYDPQWASRQLAGQNFPGSTGWATTPGGRTLSAHAAERTFLGGPGRAPINPGLIDDILTQGTRTTYRGANDTVRVLAPNLCGRCYVVVDAQNTNHIVTVMVPK